MKPHTNSPSQRAHTYDGFSDKQHIRSPMPIPPSQGDQPSYNEKLLDMKKFPNVHDIKEKKDYLEKMMNEIISNVGESFEIKQSVKELRNIFNRNEVQLRDLKNQTTDPQVSLLQKAELNRKIENLMDTNKKHKEIEDQFRNKFKMNDHQLGELKSYIIKMFEDQFSFILRLEFKELQVKQENTALQMTNLSLSQDNSSKATLIAKLTQQVNELENMLKKNNQLHCPEPHLKQERVEESHPQPTKMFQNVKKEADKPNPAMKIVQNFSTPKGDAKFQGAAKTQEVKKNTTINTLTNKKSFRLLKRETGKDTSPSPQPISIKLTSPMSYYQQDKRVKPKSFVSSKKLWSQSPSVVGPVKANNFDAKPNCSASQIFPKSLENITNIRPAPGRYSDVHEMNKDRSSVGKHENIKDFSSNKTSVEYNFTNPEKVKSFCQKNEKNPIFSSSSIELEKGSVSSLDPNGVHYDTAPSDFHSLLASEEYLHKQKVKTSAGTSNDLSSKNLQASTKHDSDPDYTVYQSNFRAVTEPDAPIRGINDEPSDSSSRRSLRKNSVYINLEENNVRPIDKVYTIVKKTSSQKKKTASFAELPPSGRQSSNKKSPNKPRITNLYASGQFSSTKKGGAYHSKHDSLVIYRTSTNKKCESKMDSNHKLIGSDLKNDYIENEVPEVKEPLQDSPQPLRVARNLLLKLK